MTQFNVLYITKLKNPVFLILVIFLFFVSCSTQHPYSIQLIDEVNSPSTNFAVSEFRNILKTNKNTEVVENPEIIIRIFLDDKNLKAQEYSITNEDGGTILISGGDKVGVMYGILELSEQLSFGIDLKKLKDQHKSPYIKKRGVKFNIPLDARTPSYDDSGDAAQKNIAEMWEWSFWEKFLDKMAIDRYNTLTLWNPHPFPSMIKMKDYPDVALNDVCVTTLKPIGKENEWAEPQMVSKNVIENLKVVKVMTIDEKIAFWQKVMKHAKDRGIDVYFFTWNVCPNAAANPVEPFYRTYKQPMWKEKPGKYGITNQMDNPITVAYQREAIKTFLLTYPDVKGIGVTAGEHMINKAGKYTREQWIWETYGLGILDAKKEQPNRKVDFIHRVWNSDMYKIMNYWKDYPDNFEVSFKYAKARLYSSPYLSFADAHIQAMKKIGLKSWWNLRNDDIFVYCWGDPDYVRNFIGYFQRDYTAGFYVGSDGYVWGKEFTSKKPELSGELEITKHWFNFMLWGRLSYDNKLDNTFFIKKLKIHFPESNAELLLSSWKAASQIIPQVNCFHWKDWDYQWSVEACLNERTGFQTVTDFMNNPTLEGSNILNSEAYANAKIAGTLKDEITPLQVADSLNNFADMAIEGASKLRNKSNSVELNNLLDDILAMSFLGKYYALKIEAATELSLFKLTKDQIHRENAVSKLNQAVEQWTNYTEVSEKNYRPQMLARTRELDWRLRLDDVKKDVSIAKEIRF